MDLLDGPEVMTPDERLKDVAANLAASYRR